MKILAIETSSEAGSVALDVGSDVFELSAEGAQTHSGWVLPAISRLLSQAGVAVSALDAVAFGAGPGAFTGLRLACGVAQGLAFSAGLPVAAVGSLEALAWAAGPGLRVVATDARMNEIYFASYRVGDDEASCLLAPRCEPPAQAVQSLTEFLLDAGPGWAGAGNGFAAYDSILQQALTAQLVSVDARIVATARAVAALGGHHFARGLAVAPALAAPVYVRDKVARTTAERIASGGRA